MYGKGQGYGGGNRYGRAMGIDGICVWKGHGYRRDMCMDVTRVWRGHGYGRDRGMEGI